MGKCVDAINERNAICLRPENMGNHSLQNTFNEYEKGTAGVRSFCDGFLPASRRGREKPLQSAYHPATNAMVLDVGMVVTGKVTGIKKFGAFVALEGRRSGLVHISEIANTYVDDVAAHLSEGQEVTVKVIGIDETGRINLSIKKAQEPVAAAVPARSPRQQSTPQGREPASFEDRLKQFMQDSNSKMSGLEIYAGKKKSRRSKE